MDLELLELPELEAPGCIELTNSFLGGENAGKLAELIFMCAYVIRRPQGVLSDSLLLDNRIVGGQRDFAHFFDIDRKVADNVDCECNDGTEIRKYRESLRARPDLLDVLHSEVYEVKADNAREIEKGMQKVNFDLEIIDCTLGNRALLNVPLTRLPGKISPGKLEPPRNTLLFDGNIGVGRIRIRLLMRFGGPGLIVYKYCLEGTLSPEVIEKIRNLLEAYRQRLLQLFRDIVRQFPPPPPVPVPVRLRDFKQEINTVSKQFPVPVQPDVWAEIGRRLVNPTKLLIFGVVMLLAPAIAVILPRIAPAVAGFFARLATAWGALTAYLGRVLTLEALNGGLGTALNIAKAKAAEADNAANEARNATNPDQRSKAVARASRAAGEAAQARQKAADLKTLINKNAKDIPAAEEKLIKSLQQVTDAVNKSDLPPEERAKFQRAAQSVIGAAAACRTGSADSARQAKAAADAADSAAQSASQSAKSVGGKPLPTPGTSCSSVVANIGLMYKHWLRNPRRSEVSLNSSPVQELAGGATRFEVANESGYQATVLVGPPTCRAMSIPSGASQTIDVVPGTPHQLAAKITDARVNVPIFPSYGSQTYQFGWLHRMHLRPVKFETQE